MMTGGTRVNFRTEGIRIADGRGAIAAVRQRPRFVAHDAGAGAAP